MDYIDSDYAATILRLEVQRQAAEAARAEQEAMHAAELAAAMEQAEVWRADYDRLVTETRPMLAATVADIDAAIPAAVDALRLAHEHVTDLLARRGEAERAVNSYHGRLARLASLMGGAVNWSVNVLSVPAIPVRWRESVFISRPWPR